MRQSEAQRKRFFLLLCCGLIAVAVVVSVLVVLLERNPGRQEREDLPEISVPSGEVLVEDIYEGKTLIPKFDFPKASYDVTKFQAAGDRVTYSESSAISGVDVSEFQGNIDWAQVKDSGMEFAMLRLGHRGHTEGGIYVDETFEANYESATAAGLQVGVYFFSQAISKAEAEEEADFVLKTLNNRELSYPVVFDWEPPFPSETIPQEDLRAYHCTGEEITGYAAAFCEKIKGAGKTPMVYLNKTQAYEFYDLSRLADYELWYAEYQKAPSLYYDFRIWQYTESANVPGIGNVDVNICFKPY